MQPLATRHRPDDISHEEDKLPIVIIGNGPVGIQVARALLNQPGDAPVYLYGDEESQPYNRVQLSSVLAGQNSWQSIESDIDQPAQGRLVKCYGVRIESIEPQQKIIVEANENRVRYSKLIIATGSRPYVPEIPGINRAGVYTLRYLSDVNALIARQARSHHCVILGGGLLGLEAARAMQRWQTQVSVIEHAPCLLPRQLDQKAATYLQDYLQGLGITVLLNSAIREIKGNDRVNALQLQNGNTIPCDTLVVSTGIVPNHEIASAAGLSVGKGVKVNDRMQTSDPDIYAVGECAEHRGQVFGLVAPGLEQAGVAAHNLQGGTSHYQGSMSATRLKVLDQQVLSIGEVGEYHEGGRGRKLVFEDTERKIYRKILIWKNRLVGVLAYGEWPEAARVQSVACEQKIIMPWQQWRFLKTGYFWPREDMSSDVSQWPAIATICQCTGVNRGRISEVVEKGANTADAVCEQTGASSVCGSCRPLVEQLVSNPAKAKANAHAPLMIAAALITALLSALFILPLQWPYQDSVQQRIQWDWLWRDTFFKQVSGFTMLGLFSVGLLISLRKRIKKLQSLGDFKYWRSIHLVLGLLVIVALVLHTGFRMGSGLNFWLMSSFVGLMLLGAINSGFIGLQHKLDLSLANKGRRQSLNWHIFLFWPVPALLGFHILKTYWF